MKTRTYGLALFFFLLLTPAYKTSAESPSAFANQESLFEALEETSEDFFDERSAQLENLWDRMEAEEKARWEKLKAEVLQKWDTYHQSTKKEWVDYSKDRSALSRTNFETGKVVVEVLVPKDSSPRQAKELAVEKLQALVQAKDASDKVVMEEMLPEKTEETIAKGEVKISAAEPITGKDGVKRKRVSVTLDMVPDHVQRRARRVLPLVRKEAERLQVDPALVLAVIHSESSFNPMARSHIPAFGLMQIVPRFAGKEAYMHRYGKEKVLSADYLYNPENNVTLGTTYLKILQSRYFKSVKDPDKQRYIIVCAYNWGPTAMRKRLLPKIDYEALSKKQLFERLLEGVPEETHNYLKRVEKRRHLYAGELKEAG